MSKMPNVIADQPNVVFEGCGQGGSMSVLKYIAAQAETPVEVEVRDKASQQIYAVLTGDEPETVKINRGIKFLFRPGPIRLFVSDWRGLLDIGLKRPTDFAKISKTEIGKAIIESVPEYREDPESLNKLLTTGESLLFAQKEEVNPVTGNPRSTDTGKWRPFSDGRLIGPLFLNDKLWEAAKRWLNEDEKNQGDRNRKRAIDPKTKQPLFYDGEVPVYEYSLDGKRDSAINDTFTKTAHYTLQEVDSGHGKEWRILPAEIAAVFYLASPDGGTGTAIAETHADLMNIESRIEGYEYFGLNQTEKSKPFGANPQYFQFLAGALPASTATEGAPNVALRILNAIDRARRLESGKIKPVDVAINGDILFSTSGVTAAYDAFGPLATDETNALDRLMADYFINLTNVITKPCVKSGFTEGTPQEIARVLSGIILPATIEHGKERPKNMDDILQDVALLVSPMSIKDNKLQGFSVNRNVPDSLTNGRKYTHEEYINKVFENFTDENGKVLASKFRSLRPDALTEIVEDEDGDEVARKIDLALVPPEYTTPTTALLFINGPDLEKMNTQYYKDALMQALRLVFPNLRTIKAAAGYGKVNSTSLAVCGPGTVSYEMLDFLNTTMPQIYKTFSQEKFVEAFRDNNIKSLDAIIKTSKPEEELPYEHDPAIVGNNEYNRACRDAALRWGKLMKSDRASYNLRYIHNAIYNPAKVGKMKESASPYSRAKPKAQTVDAEKSAPKEKKTFLGMIYDKLRGEK